MAHRANVRNVKTKRSLREALKAFSKAVDSGNAANIAKAEKEAMSAIDTAAKKAVIHKNKAARQKARLSKTAKTAGAKPTKATATKKATPKKATKAPAKKPAAKRTTAKK